MVTGGVCGGVVAMWLRREHPEAADISELAVVVERIQKAVRRLTMRAVRMGELDTDEGAAATAKAQNPPLPAPVSAKAALRARVFSQMRGNGEQR